MTDHLSTVPVFSINGVTFRCWVTDAGQRYEWRSTCGRYSAGRSGKHHWASINRRVIGDQFASLKSAMQMAVSAEREAA